MIIEKDLKIDDSVIHYKVAGNNLERTLVFLHGRPGSEYLRSSVIDELSKDFYVIAPEHP
jgi:pimeloyl-ACP methyl ester carboxylesterase